MNESCREQRTAYSERADFPVDGFDPQRPDPAQLPEVGAYFEGNNDVYAQFLSRLDGIEPPPEQREAFAAFVEANREDYRIVWEQQEAAKAKDVDGFVATLPKVVAQQELLNATARELGAEDCVWQ